MPWSGTTRSRSYRGSSVATNPSEQGYTSTNWTFGPSSSLERFAERVELRSAVDDQPQVGQMSATRSLPVTSLR